MASTYDNMTPEQLKERKANLEKHLTFIDSKLHKLQSSKGSGGVLTNIFSFVTSATPAPASAPAASSKEAEKAAAAQVKARAAAAKDAEKAAAAEAKAREKAAKEAEKEAAALAKARAAAAKEAEKEAAALAKAREKATVAATKEAAKERSLTEEREANRRKEQEAREAQKAAPKKGVAVEYDDGVARTSTRKIKALKSTIIAVLQKNGVECSEKDNVPRLSALAEKHNLIRKCEAEQEKLDK